jgi:hypothetical protein
MRCIPYVNNVVVYLSSSLELIDWETRAEAFHMPSHVHLPYRLHVDERQLEDGVLSTSLYMRNRDCKEYVT